MTPIRRAIFATYGMALTFVMMWVPWRGYENPIYTVPKDRWKPTYLGYGPVWSHRNPPAAFVAYDIENAHYTEYQSLHECDCIEPAPTTAEDKALGFTPDPPRPPSGKRYCIQSPAGSREEPRPVVPMIPDGYVSPRTYQWTTIDYGRVLLDRPP
jgi:hypothetical protein